MIGEDNVQLMSMASRRDGGWLLFAGGSWGWLGVVEVDGTGHACEVEVKLSRACLSFSPGAEV
jgi:hypothetical protein